MFSKYDAILDSFRGEEDNYWADVAVLDAIDTLNNFKADDWSSLVSVIELKHKSNTWLVACVDTLSEAYNSYNALKILVLLLNTDSEKLRLAAFDSINALLQNDTIKLSSSMIEDITLALSKIDIEQQKGIFGIVLKSLNEKINNMNQ